jgi:hypothetical protein
MYSIEMAYATLVFAALAGFIGWLELFWDEYRD